MGLKDDCCELLGLMLCRGVTGAIQIDILHVGTINSAIGLVVKGAVLKIQRICEAAIDFIHVDGPGAPCIVLHVGVGILDSVPKSSACSSSRTDWEGLSTDGSPLSVVHGKHLEQTLDGLSATAIVELELPSGGIVPLVGIAGDWDVGLTTTLLGKLES